MKSLLTGVALAVALLAVPAVAQQSVDLADSALRTRPPRPVAKAPEIDAMSGLAALAAVGAAMAFAWERRRHE